MDRNGTNFIKDWLKAILFQYDDFIKSKTYRCKIIGIQLGENKKESTLQVLISGIKNQVVEFSPKKLVSDDKMLSEFSVSDVRAITFLACKETNANENKYSNFIIGQDFENGKTIFIIKNKNSESRKSAHDLYSDDKIWDKFSNMDIKNIISTAIQEQAIDDFQ